LEKKMAPGYRKALRGKKKKAGGHGGEGGRGPLRVKGKGERKKGNDLICKKERGGLPSVCLRQGPKKKERETFMEL